MEFEHRPVLLEPTVDALLLAGFGGKGAARSQEQGGPAAATRAQSGVFVDGTFGRGGHSRELLGRLGHAAALVIGLCCYPLTHPHHPLRHHPSSAGGH